MGNVSDFGDTLKEGFNGKPEGWNTAWVAMWFVLTPIWIWINLTSTDWLVRLGSIAVLFAIPEIYSLIKRDNSLPPLTHTIRHFFPNWLAFPLIYAVVGGIGARWLGQDLDRALQIAGVAAVFGWMTDHFTLTYQGEDPFPFDERPETPSRRPRPA